MITSNVGAAQMGPMSVQRDGGRSLICAHRGRPVHGRGSRPGAGRSAYIYRQITGKGRSSIRHYRATILSLFLRYRQPATAAVVTVKSGHRTLGPEVSRSATFRLVHCSRDAIRTALL